MSTIDMKKLHDKDAKLTLKLAADSGYRSTEDARVSADQWSRIMAIVNEAPPLADMSQAEAEARGLA